MFDLGYNFPGIWGTLKDKSRRPVQPLLVRQTFLVALLRGLSLY